jgi:small subunit ribosomal protein S16
MALVIRMRQEGAKNRQSYRLVVTDIRHPRDGKYIEMVGWYNPFAENEMQAKIDQDRIRYWLNLGATLSVKAETLVKRLAPDVVREVTAKQVAKRAKRRAKKA